MKKYRVYQSMPRPCPKPTDDGVREAIRVEFAIFNGVDSAINALKAMTAELYSGSNFHVHEILLNGLDATVSPMIVVANGKVVWEKSDVGAKAH